MAREIEKLLDCYRRELAIAERALKWYADPEHWNADDWNVPSVVDPPDYGNPGGKARRALERMRKVK